MDRKHAVLCALLAFSPGAVMAQAENCATRDNNTHAKLLECVTLEGVREHQAALQAIADANNDHRVSGSAGYDQSAEYVVDADGRRLRGHRAGLPVPDVHLASAVDPRAGGAAARRPDRQHHHVLLGQRRRHRGGHRAGRPTGRCDAGLRGRRLRRFPGRQHRADQPRRLHLRDQGDQRLQRRRLGRGHLQQRRRGCSTARSATASRSTSAVTAVTQAVGQQLAATPGLVMRLKTDTFRGIATTYNVLAETRAGEPEQRRHGRRAPRLGQRGPRHQRQRLGHRRRSSRRRCRWPRSSRATRSASRGGAPRSPASSARPTT